jgi:hypothetical protein
VRAELSTVAAAAGRTIKTDLQQQQKIKITNSRTGQFLSAGSKQMVAQRISVLPCR